MWLWAGPTIAFQRKPEREKYILKRRHIFSLENQKTSKNCGFSERVRLPHFHEESALTSVLPFPVPSRIFSLFILLLLEILRISIPFRCQILEGFLSLLFGFAPGKQIGNLSLIGFVYFSSNLSALKKQ